jgi:hypothetical protein
MTTATITGPTAAHALRGWILNDDVWNPDSLVYGQNYTISTTYNPTDLQQGTQFDWSFPGATSSIPLAFPNIKYGVDPLSSGTSGPQTDATFPVQISQLSTFNVNYNVGISGDTSGFAVALELWITSQPNGGKQSITNQVMVWVHEGAFSPTGHLISSYTDPSDPGMSGNIWNRAIHTSNGTNWQYSTLVTNAAQLSGQINVTALLGELESLNIVSGSSYVADVELGAEVAFGQGSMTVNSLSFATSVDGGPVNNNAYSATTIADNYELRVNTPDSGSKLTFAGPSGTLILEAAATFAGTVVGFAGQDGIDLTRFSFSDRTTLGYSENGKQTGGTLTVTDGSHVASIALLGNYTAASFVIGSNGHSGSSITEATNTTSHALLTAPH